MDEKGNFECINDEFANSNITEKFYKLYDNEWVHLSRKLEKLDTSLSELELIHKLTEMLKVKIFTWTSLELNIIKMKIYLDRQALL